MPDALDAQSANAELAQAPVGPFTPPALEGAFDAFATAGMLPSQMRVVEAIFDRALGEIFAHAVAYHPGDLGVLAKWLFHLRIEPPAEVRTLVG